MTIEDLWNEHRETAFPSVCRGHDVDGIDVVMLDADIAGCVSTYVKRRQLDVWRTAGLGVCYRNVTYLLGQMPVEGRVVDAVREQTKQ